MSSNFVAYDIKYPNYRPGVSDRVHSGNLAREDGLTKTVGVGDDMDFIGFEQRGDEDFVRIIFRGGGSEHTIKKISPGQVSDYTLGDLLELARGRQ